ncbi:MAG: beta-ketoacyl synthase N-terminal-like domain-containing protein [Candidatus Parabeggiatoa sp.]|nr:beta-ketoacyl synthase N-terminal-like domain-containing protein [Candidatus Parabeggiatoa sp.]
MNNKKHVIITRYEQISAFGCGIQALEQAKMDVLFNAGEQVAPHYGATKDYDFFRLTSLVSNQETRQMDELGRITVTCAHLVLQQEQNINKEKTGIFLGGGFGCQVSNQSFIDSLIEHGSRFVKPIVFRNTASNAPAGHLAINFALTGTNIVFNSGMVSGAQALALAFHELHSGESEVILTGASDCCTPLLVERYRQQTQQNTVSNPIPLLDGAMIGVLRLSEITTPGWHLLAVNLGRISASAPSRTLTALIEDCLVRAGIDFEQVDNVLLNAGASCYWSRRSEPQTLNQVIEILSEILPVQVENTAVVPMLALAQALQNLPKSMPPLLFMPEAQKTNCSNNGYFIFCTVGHDENAVILVLNYLTTEN